METGAPLTPPLVHGGGNFHLESGEPQGFGHATRLIVNENTNLTESQIIQHWRDYQNLETTIYTPYPASVDSTQHIDMWMIMLDDDKVMISQWVNEPNTSWAINSNNAANAFAARGFQVYRVPAVRSGGTHYTFTNAVICNDLVLVPSYTNSTASPHNATALAVWQQAYPDKTIRQINCQAIVTSAGVMHCIVMHVPAPSGAAVPRGDRGVHGQPVATNGVRASPPHERGPSPPWGRGSPARFGLSYTVRRCRTSWVKLRGSRTFLAIGWLAAPLGDAPLPMEGAAPRGLREIHSRWGLRSARVARP